MGGYLSIENSEEEEEDKEQQHSPFQDVSSIVAIDSSDDLQSLSPDDVYRAAVAKRRTEDEHFCPIIRKAIRKEIQHMKDHQLLYRQVDCPEGVSWSEFEDLLPIVMKEFNKKAKSCRFFGTFYVGENEKQFAFIHVLLLS